MFTTLARKVGVLSIFKHLNICLPFPTMAGLSLCLKAWPLGTTKRIQLLTWLDSVSKEKAFNPSLPFSSVYSFRHMKEKRNLYL